MLGISAAVHSGGLIEVFDQGFNSQFAALLGFTPMRWQERLFERFITGDIPSAIDIPTGLGKTAVMAIWLLARQRNSSLPRRLVYVVDRRAVVDQATVVADSIAAAAPALNLSPIVVSTLRGQFADNRRWLENPAAVAIVVGTVDMVGSRLLFEGYGVGRGMRPFHAGLLGADTLVLLDEAHLCPPFQRLVGSIAAMQAAHQGSRIPAPQLQLASLSATHGSVGSATFTLEPSDVDPNLQPMAAQRFYAEKHLTLHQLESRAELPNWLVEHAEALPPGRNVVFCHSRDTAARVAAALEKKLKRENVNLLTGARRAWDRGHLLAWLREHNYLDGADAPASPPSSCLVATAAGEVGVDLDADNMVSDLVAFERMAQRLGRVNRRGGDGRRAQVQVAFYPPDAKQSQDANFLLHLHARRNVIAALPALPDLSRDASPAALARLRSQNPDLVRSATTPDPDHPALDPAVVEAWSLTSLPVHPGRPTPAPWIRGWDSDGEAEVTILFRRWLPWRAGTDCIRSEADDFFAAAPPHPLELVRVEASLAAKWLLARTRHAPDDSGPEAGLVEPGVILLDSANEYEDALTCTQVIAAQRDLRDRIVGHTIVVAAALGGLHLGLLQSGHAGAPPCWDDGWPEPDLEAVGLRLCAEAPPDGWYPISGFSWYESGQFPRTIAARRSPQSVRAGNSSVSRRRQSLCDHTAWVAEAVAVIATDLNLAPAHRNTLALAANLHDDGKSRRLWQDAMGAPFPGRPFAKTKSGCTPSRLRIAGLTYRHEFGSLAAAEAAAASDPAWLALPADLRDLGLHLIAAHHGNARPLIAPADPELPPSSPLLRQRATRAALRYARLQQQWGPWGLAWWEAVFRAADQSASRRLDADRSQAQAGGHV